MIDRILGIGRRTSYRELVEANQKLESQLTGANKAYSSSIKLLNKERNALKVLQEDLKILIARNEEALQENNKLKAKVSFLQEKADKLTPKKRKATHKEGKDENSYILAPYTKTFSLRHS